MPSKVTKSTLPFNSGATTFGPTLKEAVAVLLVGSGSATVEEAVAVLLTTAPATAEGLTVATMTALSVAPASSEGNVMVRAPPAPLHTPCGESQERNVTSAGRLSESVTAPVAMPALFV